MILRTKRLELQPLGWQGRGVSYTVRLDKPIEENIFESDYEMFVMSEFIRFYGTAITSGSHCMETFPVFEIFGLEGERVGFCALRINGNQAELSVILRQEHADNGYGAEAAGRLLDYGFLERGLHRITAVCDGENYAAANMLGKIGMRREAEFRKSRRLGDEWRDELAYAILYEDYMRDLTLETDRLILRQFRPDDFDAVHSYASDAENTRFMLWGPNSPEDTAKFMRRVIATAAQEPRTNFEFAVCLKGGGLIGACGLDSVNAGYGIILHRDHWKHGYGPEICRAMIDLAFGKLGLSRLTASCDEENYGSMRIMERSGMRRELHHIRNRIVRGEERGEYVYAILSDEYERGRP